MGRKPKPLSERKCINRSEYNKLYYLENKKRISERRKKKYREDPEYKFKVNNASNEYKKRKKSEIDKLIKEGKIKESDNKKYSRKPILIKINGIEKEAYPMSYMIRDIQRSKSVLNYWIRMNMFPKTPILTGIRRRERYYTKEMIFVAKMEIWKRGDISFGDTSLYDAIYEEWDKLGVFGDIEYI